MKTKINIDRKPLSAQKISSMKDFGALKAKMAATGMTSLVGTWFAATFAGIAILAGISGAFQNQSESGHDMISQESSYHSQSSEILVNEPSIDINSDQSGTPMSIHIYNNKDGYEFIHETGSKISIPANAFYDKTGQLPKEIEFHYREFHDPISNWLSGIPMEYDSLETYFFESAGMNELRAYSNGEELQLNPEKPIEISLVSFDDSDEMNLYSLNDKTGDWTYLNHLPHENLMETIQDENAHIEATIPELEIVEKKIDELETKIASIPAVQSYNQQKHSFDLDVDLKDFPALKGFKNVVFEVVDQQKFDVKIYDVEWENAQILQTNRPNIYQLQLTKQAKIERIDVIPVLKGKELEKALKTQDNQKNKLQAELDKHVLSKEEIVANYDKKLAQFEQERQSRELETQEKLDQDEKKIRQQKALNYLTKQSFQSNTKANHAKLEKAVIRTRNFFASMTGIFNFDCARRAPQARRIARRISRQNANNEDERGFEDNKFGKQKKVTLINKITGATIIPVTLFLIEKGRNLIYKFNKDEQNKVFAFNPEANNVVWGMTPDNKIAVFRSEDFDHLPMEADTYQLDVTVSPETLHTKKDIENFLGISSFEESN